jgi:hypothetical protein
MAPSSSPAAAATAWRSPLSILMGARRNDNEDLELRADGRRADGGGGGDGPPSSGPPALPPRGAFPPPVSSGLGGGGGGGGDGDVADECARSRPAFDRPLPSDFASGGGGDDDGDVDDLRGTDRSAAGRRAPGAAGAVPRGAIPPPPAAGGGGGRRRRADADADAAPPRGGERAATIGTTVNFANSIIGAGAAGLGGAFAAGGGGASVLALAGSALLTKMSLDLIVDLGSCPRVVGAAAAAAESRDRGDGGDDDDDDDDVAGDDGFEDGGGRADPSVSWLERFLLRDRRYLESRGGGEMADEDERNESPPPIGIDGIAKSGGGGGAVAREGPTRGGAMDSSPLMAREEEEEGEGKDDEDEDDVGNGLYATPTETTGLFLDHPLASSSALLRRDMTDRYDSLTTDATQPRYFSPLHIMEAADAPGDATTASAGNADPHQRPCTYEEIGRAAFGPTGRLAVLISKSLYAGGCLVAYVVVVRDNFGPALRRVAIGPSSALDSPGGDRGRGWLYDDDFLAFLISAVFMLPLSCPRTMKPLAKFSFVSILSMVFLAFAVVYLYFSCANPEGGAGGDESSSFYENWIEIRSFSGLVESLGCFVFTFVCHHTVNLAYESLPPPVRNPKVWRRVSTNSIAVALETSLAIGVFSYLTFGSKTPADVVSWSPCSCTHLISPAEKLI